MTTIAYKQGQIAGDTLVTCNGAVNGYTPKIGKIRNVLFGAAGCTVHAQDFERWVRQGMPQDDYPPMGTWADSPAEGFVVLGDFIITLNPDGPCMLRAQQFAIGSGQKYAIGAMLCGKSALQAVKIAAQVDRFTGGEIMSLRADV